MAQVLRAVGLRSPNPSDEIDTVAVYAAAALFAAKGAAEGASIVVAVDPNVVEASKCPAAETSKLAYAAPSKSAFAGASGLTVVEV